jgi:hypothetical protein
MDCKTARMLIEFALPRCGELDAQESEALDNHLRDCGECAQAARVELDADRHVSRAVRDVMVPSGLRERILERMQSERRPWYRRRAGRFVAAAAAVLLSVGIGVGYWIGFYRPAFDASAFAEKLPSPGNESSADQLEIWFRDTYRVKTTMPRRIDYQYFVSAGREELDGQLIPHLIFINEKNRLFAEVWVLTADRFDIKRTLQKAAQGGSGKMMFKLIEDEQHPESVVYLIRYSGDSLDWLITQQATNI